MTSVSLSGQLFSLGCLAKRWDCSVRHLRRLIASGQLGSVKVGGLTRIPQSEAERYLAVWFTAPKSEEQPRRFRSIPLGNVANIADEVIGRQRRGAR